MSKTEFLIIPRKHRATGGVMRLPAAPVIFAPLSEDALARDALLEGCRGAGLRPRAAENCEGAQVLLLRNGRVRDPEGYRLNIDRRSAVIEAATAAGMFYGAQTMVELLRMHGRMLPCGEIDDAPQFRRRGVYLDCSRGKVPKVSTLKSLIDLLAAWKINELQLYIENVFTFRKHPAIGRGFDPFTPDDILDLQDYCNRRFINFVPSLATFGHMERILMLPRYRHLGELPGHRGRPGGTTLNPGHPGSLRLVADMFSEFVPLFKALDFNICGDEPWELGRGASQAAAQKRGVGRVYLDFVLKLRKLCLKHGKRVNLWSDIVLNHSEIIPAIPKDIVMLNWQYAVGRHRGRMQRSREITDAGLPLVCCPGTNSWQSHGSRLDMATAVVSKFARIGVQCGAEGLLNTDWGDAGHRNPLASSLCGYAHGAAHAWNTKGTDDRRHVERFTRHTFDDINGRMAAALRILGAAESGSWAYTSFNESLHAPKMLKHHQGTPRMDHVDFPPAFFKQRRAALEKLSFGTLARPADSFKRLMIEEYGLATAMELAAWERLRLAKRIRAQAAVKPAELRAHERQLMVLARRFALVWKKVNRPSRLCDNMDMFHAAMRELRAAAGRC